MVLLGYRDSGMPDTEANAHPDAFANAPMQEAVARLVEVIRRERPQVLVTYPDDQSGYPHPDHLRVHDVSIVAFDVAGDPGWHPELGAAWAPSKLYYSVWSLKRFRALHEAFVERGLESPFSAEWFERPSQDHRVTTSIQLGDHAGVRWDALLAHETQVDPTSPFWFGLPREVVVPLQGVDDYILARSRVPTSSPESDLFAGVGP